ncbi:Calcineurin subunit B [Folsomia candida]|uniref:Calcineurin subunit B n=2 Tax=Folsomia candida TaxID=158441 RepID=A0A226D8L1_FOLCA|nr:Calcineurin subunit B [Folsomia candida]
MPTFCGDLIDLTDVPVLLKRLDFSCTEDQMAGYLTFLRDCHGGKLPLEVGIASLGVADDAREVMRVHIHALDRDRDGFVDEFEFKATVQLCLLHDPSLAKVNFNKFVEEADTDKDGKVSIAEATEWFCEHGQNLKM